MNDGLALLLRALQSAGLEIDVEAALDSVWLALRMRERELAGEATATAATPTAAIGETGAAGLSTATERGTTTRRDEGETRMTYAGRVTRQAAAAADITAPARSVTLARTAALPQSRDLIRSLRPLRRRVVSPRQGPLDVDTTVQRAAEEDLWIPAFASARERWLDVLLVADHGRSMIIWKDTIDEFERVLRNSGAFRSVRSWWLESDGPIAVTARGRGPQPDTPENLTRLVRGAERSVVLLMSDCVGDRWHDGAIPRLVARWSMRLPTALIQVTPQWFWSRTALGDTVGSRFRSAIPAMANHRLRWDSDAFGAAGVSPQDARTLLRVPTTTLAPDAVARVAGLLAGVGREWAPGVVFDLTWTGEAPGPAARSGAADRVKLFRALASRPAQRLAAAFSASPVTTLGVLRLLRRDLIPDATPFAEAEVLLGGLLHVKREEARWDAGAELPLRFHDGVRSLLQDTAIAGDVLRVLTHAASVADTGVGPTFTAWLNDPAAGLGQLDPAESAFAQAAAQMLARLGGRYARIVKPALADAGAATTVETATEWPVETRTWSGHHAVLVVHGARDASSPPPPVRNQLLDLLRNRTPGNDAAGAEFYEIQLDQVAEWPATKASLSPQIAALTGFLTSRIGDQVIGPSAALTIADLIWPVLDGQRRAAARDHLLAQLQQIVNDGIAAGVAARDQTLSIVCHSSGCLHVYEALHHAAVTPAFGLQPGTHEVRFENVIFVASPVQIVRSAARELPTAFDDSRGVMHCTKGSALSPPAQADSPERIVPSVRRWVSIAGEMDPVSGYFFRHAAAWACMQVPGQENMVDEQTTLGIDSREALADRLAKALRPDRSPVVTPGHPHCWENYLDHYETDLLAWLAPVSSSSTDEPPATGTARPREAGPHSLPAPAVFVGRRGEVERLEAWVGGHSGGARAIVLAGPAGIGKSALAHAAIAAWQRRFPDAAPFVWSFHRDPSNAVIYALLHHLAPAPSLEGEEWDASVARAMAENNHVFIVFDGVDGIDDLDRVIRTVDLILNKGGQVLFTTRETSGMRTPMAMETALTLDKRSETFDVGPLAPPEVEELARRLLDANADRHQVDEARQPAIVDVVQELSGGNPAVVAFLLGKMETFAPDVLREELARGTGEGAAVNVGEWPAIEDLLTRADRARHATAAAIASEREGRLDEAAARYEEVISQRANLPSIRERAHALFGRGRVNLTLGKNERANADLADAVGLFRSLGSPSPELPDALEAFAGARARLGRADEAVRLLEETLNLRKGADDARGTFRAVVALAAIDTERADWRAALARLHEALEVAQSLNDPVMVGTAYLSMGRAQLGTGDLEAASYTAVLASHHFERAEARRELAIALGFVAQVEMSRHNYQEARTVLERARTLETEETEALEAQLRQLAEIEQAAARRDALDVLNGDDRVVSVECMVTGRVQGVGYRAFVQRVAAELGVEGNAENLPDGRVRVRATGARPALKRLEDRLRQGPSMARVEQVETRLVEDQYPQA